MEKLNQAVGRTGAETSKLAADPAAGWVGLLANLGRGEDTFEHGSASVSDVLYQFALRSSVVGLEQPTSDAAKGAAASKFEEAKSLRSEGTRTDVLSSFRAAAVLNPNMIKYWQAIAVEALNREQLVLADAASLRVLQLNAQHAASHVVRAEILIELRRPDLAMIHLLLAIELGSSDGALSPIERCYSRCVKIWPEGNWSFSELARILVSRGHRREAVAAFVRGVSGSRAEPLTRTLIDLCSAGRPLAATLRRSTLDLPVVLISQVQRSGGTLLSQLFDGHPDIFVHPHEIQIGRPQKWDWPKLDLNGSPREWLQALFELSVTRFLAKGGYAKADQNSYALKDRKPFNFSLDTLCTEFLRLSANARSQRQIINAYLTAFFIAWQNHKATGRERLFAGFCPRLILHQDSVRRFFADYPDGHLISCIRNPISWYASASRHDKEYASVSRAMRLWIRSTRAALALARKMPRQIHLLTYDALVTDTKGVMMRLAKDLEISFDAVLLAPTYLADPILPNSSFDTNEYGVHQRSLDQRSILSPADLATISQAALPLYEESVRYLAER